MMSVFEKISYYYKKGIYKQTHVQKFLEKAIITQEEYNEILGVTEETVSE